MNRRYIVQLFHGKKLDKQWAFATESESVQFYNSKISAIKFGLVGFTLTYPRLEHDGFNDPRAVDNSPDAGKMMSALRFGKR